MATTQHTFLVDGMHCASCALLIDDTLQDLPGVTHTHTTSKTGRTTVELNTNRTSTDEVIHAIQELGYHASALPS